MKSPLTGDGCVAGVEEFSRGLTLLQTTACAPERKNKAHLYLRTFESPRKGRSYDCLRICQSMDPASVSRSIARKPFFLSANRRLSSALCLSWVDTAGRTLSHLP